MFPDDPNPVDNWMPSPFYQQAGPDPLSRQNRAWVNRYAAQGYFYNNPQTGLPFQNTGYRPVQWTMPDVLGGNKWAIPGSVLTNIINPLDYINPFVLANLPPQIKLSMVGTPTIGINPFVEGATLGLARTPQGLVGSWDPAFSAYGDQFQYMPQLTHLTPESVAYHEHGHQVFGERPDWESYLETQLSQEQLDELRYRYFGSKSVNDLMPPQELLPVMLQLAGGDPDIMREMYGPEIMETVSQLLGPGPAGPNNKWALPEGKDYVSSPYEQKSTIEEITAPQVTPANVSRTQGSAQSGYQVQRMKREEPIIRRRTTSIVRRQRTYKRQRMLVEVTRI